MFCMARIVCHLKFEAIVTQSALRVSGSHTGGAKKSTTPQKLFNYRSLFKYSSATNNANSLSCGTVKDNMV